MAESATFLEGALDVVTRARVAGWVRGPNRGVAPCTLEVDGLVVARILARGPTPFDIVIDPPMSAAPHLVTVVREADDAALQGCPAVLTGLRGHLDEVSRERLRGWAQDTGDPKAAVTLDIQVDGEVVGTVIANVLRDDLARHGIGNGRHSFDHVFQPPLSRLRHLVAVNRDTDGAALAQSPVALPTPEAFDVSLRGSIADALDTAVTDADLRIRIEFLAGQMERLLRRRSDRATTRTERLAAQQFKTRWEGHLTPDGPGQEFAASIHAPLARRALIIDSTMPNLARDAGSAAVLSHALSLQRLGHEIVFAPADMSAKGADTLERLGIACAHAPWFASVEELLQAQSHCFDVVYLHRVACALPYLALVRRHLPKARVLYSVADLHHIRLARQALAEDRPELVEPARVIREQELLAAHTADAVITHSAVEADMLRQAIPSLRVHVIPWSVVPAPDPTPFDRRSGLAFIGHYGHMPNIDAALWLVHEVMPLLQRLDPGIVCTLAGSAMPPTLMQPRPGVVALGAVAVLATLFAGLRMTVAPLQYGAGIKGKVLDSLAAGVPCVCTPIAMEGLALGPALRSLVANDPQGFAASIHRLHTDPALHAACRREGLDYITNQLGPERIDALMRAAIQ